MPDQYQQQVRCSSAEIDMDFWRQPHGVKVADDELEFLLIPDEVEAKAILRSPARCITISANT